MPVETSLILAENVAGTGASEQYFFLIDDAGRNAEPTLRPAATPVS